MEGTGRQWKHDTCAVSLVVYISLCRLQLPAHSSDHSKGRSCLVQSHSQLWCTVESASAAGKGSLDSLRPCTNQCTPCMCHDVNTVEREGGEEYSAAGSLWTADPAEREWADSRGAPLVASGAWGDQGKAGSKPGRPEREPEEIRCDPASEGVRVRAHARPGHSARGRGPAWRRPRSCPRAWPSDRAHDFSPFQLQRPTVAARPREAAESGAELANSRVRIFSWSWPRDRARRLRAAPCDVGSRTRAPSRKGARRPGEDGARAGEPPPGGAARPEPRPAPRRAPWQQRGAPRRQTPAGSHGPRRGDSDGSMAVPMARGVGSVRRSRDPSAAYCCNGRELSEELDSSSRPCDSSVLVLCGLRGPLSAETRR